MQSDDLVCEWRRAFGDVWPAGFAFRKPLRDRWVRIHNLANERRWPENSADRAELLRRQNSAACEVLGEGESCLIFVTFMGEACTSPAVVPGYWSELGLVPSSEVCFDSEGDWMLLACVKAIWRAGEFDGVLLDVATDSRPIAFVNCERESIFSPYDGGADLAVRDVESRRLLAERFSDWMSDRPDGL